MGGAADLPQRSSSPLKRRASDLDGDDVHKAEVTSSQKEDVDMVTVSRSDLPEGPDVPLSEIQIMRASSFDMLKHAQDEVASDNNGLTKETVGVDLKNDVPPIDVQITTVKSLMAAASETPLEEGDQVYLVSKRWLDAVISRGSDARTKSKVEPEGEIGPIDNSDIIEQVIKDCDSKDFAVLKPGLSQDMFELFPKDVWNMVLEWYGIMPGTIPILRTAHNTALDKTGIPNIQFEYYPLVFTIHRLWSEGSTINLTQKLKSENPSAPVLVVSRSMGYQEFLRKLKKMAGVDISQKVRVWGIPRLQPAAEPAATYLDSGTPPPSRPNSPSSTILVPGIRKPQDSWTDLLLDVATFLTLEKGTGRQLVEAADQSNNSNYNGHSDLSMTGLGESQSLALDEHVSGNDYVSNYVPKKNSKAVLRGASNLSNSQTNSGRNSPALSSGPMTRGRTGAQRSGRVTGTVGLGNMGNTCYMNSALQCVRSVEELTKYFLTGASIKEINEDNPLGNHGNVARAYGKLLASIYADSVQPSVVPREFKNTIGRYAPSFSGYGQQDSQEFLGFLLDGLQEDLSRVKKKPYIEKPDSTDEMVNDPEAIRQMAATVWDISKKRDDSVIADLFTGMYKSTVVCPVCDKVSITFDPFNNLTLQLPIESAWTSQITYLPLNSKPIRIIIDIDKQGTIRVMKEFISQKVGVPAEQLFVAEEFKFKFYKQFGDNLIASEEIGAQDNIYVFELEAKPTNWPAPARLIKKKKSKFAFNNDSEEEEIPGWEDPLAERMLVPVFYRHPNTDPPPRYGTRKEWNLSPIPHFIVLTPEEARDEDRIKRKVIEKAATLTTYLFDDDGAEESAEESVDPDIVLTNGSDSSEEGKLVANSVDGEDGLVDITMKDSNNENKINGEGAITPESGYKPLPPSPFTKQRRPKFLKPGSFLDPQFQNMFQLKYFKSSNSLVPTGWTDVDEDKTYPTLTSRAPQTPDDESFPSTDRTDSESDEDEDQQNSVIDSTRMNDESSDEDELSGPTPVILPVRPAGSSVKGQQRRKQTPKIEEIQEIPDNGPLVRLGEGIVVDWVADAYEHLFGNNDINDHSHGRPTYHQLELLHDELRIAKVKARTHRKKTGITLDDCLDEFGREEILSEQDTWYCPRCKEHRRAAKKFELWRTPDILVVHLKRFSSSQYRRDKLDVLVDFPIDGLDLTTRVVEAQAGKEEVYDLFAVDDHWGGLGGGHYTAFAKNFYDHEWYEYNDSSVLKLKDTSRIVTSSAYLLFYRRRSDGPLGGPKFQQIYAAFDKSSETSETSEPSEDDATSSGEGRGLVTNSSLRGSPSALTGVGATRRPHANLGLASGETTTVNPKDLNELPAYGAHDSDDMPLLSGDVEMNERLPLQASIEDEGVDMDYQPKQAPTIGNWNWGNLDLDNKRTYESGAGAGSEIDANGIEDVFERSDVGSAVVEDNSSAGSSSRRGRLDDFNNATPADGDFEEPEPVPDMDDSAYAENISRYMASLPNISPHLAANEEVYDIPSRDEEDDVAEIHVEEGEGLNPNLD